MNLNTLLIGDLTMSASDLYVNASAIERTRRFEAGGKVPVSDELRSLVEAAKWRVAHSLEAARERFHSIEVNDSVERLEAALRDGKDEHAEKDEGDSIELVNILLDFDEWCCAARALGINVVVPERAIVLAGAFVDDFVPVCHYAETFMHYSGIVSGLPEYDLWERAASSKTFVNSLADLKPLADGEVPEWLSKVLDNVISLAKEQNP